jgi:hypothetical protein
MNSRPNTRANGATAAVKRPLNSDEDKRVSEEAEAAKEDEMDDTDNFIGAEEGTPKFTGPSAVTRGKGANQGNGEGRNTATAAGASNEAEGDDESIEVVDTTAGATGETNKEGTGASRLDGIRKRATLYSKVAAAPAPAPKVQQTLNMQAKAKQHTEELFLHLSTVVEPTPWPSKDVRATCGNVFTRIITHPKIVCVLVRKSKRQEKKLKHITSAAMNPTTHDDLLRYIVFTNDSADFSKPVKAKKGKMFSGIFSIGTLGKATEDELSGLFIDLAEQGINIEVKKYQSEHSSKAFLATNVSGDIPLSVMQNLGQKAFHSAIRELFRSQSGVRRGMMEEAISRGDYDVLVTFDYPPHNYQRYVEGQPVVDTKCKQVMSFEINMAIYQDAIEAMPLLKAALREEGLGRSICLLIPKGKESSSTSVKRYKDWLNTSVGHNKLLSTTELRNIRTIEEEFTIELANSQTLTTTLKKLLLGAKTNNGNDIFSAVYSTEEGEFAANYYNMGDRQAAAQNVTQHVAAWLLYHLIFDIKARSNENVEDIMRRHFNSSQREVAFSHSNYNSQSRVVTIHRDQQDLAEEDTEFLDLQSEPWFDLAFLNPTVSHGNTAAGVIFDPDANSIGSMNTQQYMAHEYGGHGIEAILDQIQDEAEADEADDEAAVDVPMNNNAEQGTSTQPTAPAGASTNNAAASSSTAPPAAGSTGLPPPPKTGVVEAGE